MTGAAPCTEEELAALQELGNIAFSHAATALSTLAGKRVDITVPGVRLAAHGPLDDALSHPVDESVVVTLRILGEREGSLAVAFPREDARALARLLATLADPDEPGPNSILAEVANVMTGAALLSLHRFLGVRLLHGTPTVREGRQAPSGAHPASGPHYLVVEAEFTVEGRVARGAMLITLEDISFFLDALVANLEGA